MNEHDASFAPPVLLREFAAYLSSLPWIGNGIDWRTITHEALPLDAELTDDDVASWTLRTRLGRYPLALVMAGPTRSGLTCGVCEAFRDIDLLSWALGVPEIYVCGVRRRGATLEPVYSDFVEQRFTGSYVLRARAS